MPKLFTKIQKGHPQREMKDARSKGGIGTCSISHVQTFSGEKPLKFCSIDGYESCFRRQWPNYRRSPFTAACAFDRSEIVRMLVVDFKCDLGQTHLPSRGNVEDGLELVDERGQTCDWHMTGFDLTIEFAAGKKLKKDVRQFMFKLTKVRVYGVGVRG